jgi:hypothetical protein
MVTILEYGIFSTPLPLPSPSPSFKGRGNGLYMGHFMEISMKIYPAEYSLSFTFCNIL